jgi:hypothetical protein
VHSEHIGALLKDRIERSLGTLTEQNTNRQFIDTRCKKVNDIGEIVRRGAKALPIDTKLR